MASFLRTLLTVDTETLVPEAANSLQMSFLVVLNQDVHYPLFSMAGLGVNLGTKRCIAAC